MSKSEEPSGPPPYEQPSAPPGEQHNYQHGYPPQQGYKPEQGYVYPPPQAGYAAPPVGPAVAYPQYQYAPVQPGGVVVTVQSQTPYNGPVPDDYCTFSVLNTLCCCCIIGIFAIVKSQSVRDAINRGDLQGAARLSAEAKKLNFIALGVGIAVNVIYIAFMVVYVMFFAGAFYNFY